jgi:tetratricopeptide (TPR) repeat protein
MRLKIISLFLVFSIFAFNISAQSEDENYAKGLHLYYTGHYDFAAESFTDCLKNNPGHAYAHLYRGNCYAFMHKFKEAKKDFNAASKKIKDNAELYFGYGFMYNEMGQYQKAIGFLDKALLIKPRFALAYNARGVAYQSLGKPKAAMENYTDAIKADSTLAVAYNNRGTAIYENQDIAAATNFDIKTAIKDFDMALKMEPDLCVARRNRGLAYSFIKKYDLALIDLDAAIKCDEKNPLYYLNRGSVLTEMREYDRALDDYKHALLLNPKQAEAYILMGETKEKSGSLQDAVMSEMNAALIDKNFRPLANYNIGRFYAMNNDKTLMLKYLKLANTYGYFGPDKNLSDFLKNQEFLPYKNDPDFNAFRTKVRGKRM